jgi:putative transcriptional regulator
MIKRAASKSKTGVKSRIGEEVITSLKEAIAWAEGERVAVRVTKVEIPSTDVRSVRRKLRLSQAEFAAKFGFQPATLKNWEQGRTRPDGAARVLLAVIERHPEAVEDALRRAR